MGLRRIRTKYTCWKKRCRVKRVSDGQCDTMELCEMVRASLLLGLVSLYSKYFLSKII